MWRHRVTSTGELQTGGVKQRYYGAKGGGGSKVGWQVAKLQTPGEGAASAVVICMRVGATVREAPVEPTALQFNFQSPLILCVTHVLQ